MPNIIIKLKSANAPMTSHIKMVKSAFPVKLLTIGTRLPRSALNAQTEKFTIETCKFVRNVPPTLLSKSTECVFSVQRTATMMPTLWCAFNAQLEPHIINISTPV